MHLIFVLLALFCVSDGHRVKQIARAFAGYYDNKPKSHFPLDRLHGAHPLSEPLRSRRRSHWHGAVPNSLKAIASFFLASAEGIIGWQLAGCSRNAPLTMPRGPRKSLCQTRARHQGSASMEIKETWLNMLGAANENMAECIQNGDVVLEIPNVASKDEVQWLLQAGVAASKQTGNTNLLIAEQSHGLITGRTRMAVGAQIPQAAPVCEQILLRVLDTVDEQLPSIYELLFKPSEDWPQQQPLNAQGVQPTVAPPFYLEDSCPSLRKLYEAGELEYSEGEPAINVYTNDGYFGAHKDHLALTMIMPLTSPSEFTGGGTGFWRGGRDTPENTQSSPDVILAPEPGSVLLFGGDVTHAGMPVMDGLRSVFVASMSTRTEESQAIRTQGFMLRRLLNAGVPEISSSAIMPVAPSVPVASSQSFPGLAALSGEDSESDFEGYAVPDVAANVGNLPPERSAIQRMMEMKNMKDQGFLTQEEYDKLRKDILSDIELR